ncbi:hypothetical protein [Paraliobacillus ryukyuensis]|uniref:hypothetical protein n=1 Tax=Paraliobacillus ryukyuensis TaxID=200904 RepID=UPI0009A5BB07|nr:hypothetical protein [Paraliobacillus ryukyuensis]
MRHLPKWGILFVIGCLCLGYIVVNGQQSYRYNDIRVLMNESMDAAISANYDKSNRVNDGHISLNKRTLEEAFKDEMNQTNMKLAIKDYSFSYLETDEGFLQGVKVKIVDGQGTPYSIAYINKNIIERS